MNGRSTVACRDDSIKSSVVKNSPFMLCLTIISSEPNFTLLTLTMTAWWWMALTFGSPRSVMIFLSLCITAVSISVATEWILTGWLIGQRMRYLNSIKTMANRLKLGLRSITERVSYLSHRSFSHTLLGLGINLSRVMISSIEMCR